MKIVNCLNDTNFYHFDIDLVEDFIADNLLAAKNWTERLSQRNYPLDIINYNWQDRREDEALTQEEIQVMQLLTHKLATLEA